MTPRGPLPALDRPDAGTLVVELATPRAGESPDDLAARIVGRHERPPAGLLSLSCFAALDGTVVATLGQWAAGHPAGEPSAETPPPPGEPARLEFRLHRSAPPDPGRTPGCFNIVIRPSTGHRTARDFADSLLARSGSLPELNQPITGSFHIGVDGRSTLLYSEWETKEEHDEHVETMRHTMADLYEGLPAPLSVHQYRHCRSLEIP
ncbi:hypothetical protein [Amycolatopsis sp. MEPSY49]|uniref:hypothetical protein n=1 Tax=Amycolatopsis sp. MEPSY49 TaxID=3151600 RepID=UPI003EF7B922